MASHAEPETVPTTVATEVVEHRRFFQVSGIVSIVLGVFAILMPYVATLAANLVLGALLLASGLVEVATSFQARRASRVAAGFFLGLLAVVAGLLMLFFPPTGILALTAILTAFLFASGGVKLYFAWQVRGSTGWLWLLVGGLLSVLLAALIWAGLPDTAFWVLGLFLGVDLIFYGVTLLSTLGAADRAAKQPVWGPRSPGG
jgi:uncharacterized membrane protein HdeD (DUF308 family)